MTDKEWKKLCDWVKSLKNDRVYICKRTENDIVKYMYITIGDAYTESLDIYQDGSIYFANGYDCVIVRNRSYKQIKAIITNLL